MQIIEKVSRTVRGRWPGRSRSVNGVVHSVGNLLDAGTRGRYRSRIRKAERDASKYLDASTRRVRSHAARVRSRRP